MRSNTFQNEHCRGRRKDGESEPKMMRGCATIFRVRADCLKWIRPHLKPQPPKSWTPPSKS